MKTVVLTPRGKKEYRIVELRAETETTYYGRHRSNPFCPDLEWPKFAWEESDEFGYCPDCGLVEIEGHLTASGIDNTCPNFSHIFS